MIAVSSSGTGFRALAAYLVRGRTGLEEGRIGWASPRNLPTADPELAATLMRATAAQNVRVEKPVYHLGLAFDPGDPVDRAAMERVADRVLGALGLSEHQALIVAHQDRAHPHVHVLVNRVHPETGRVWDRWQDMPAIQAVLRAEERALGLRVVPGHLHAAEVERGAEVRAQSVAPRVPTRDARDVSATGETPAPSLVERARAVLPAVREATSWDAVDQSLAAAGLRLERRGSGLVVTDGTGYVKASSVGPDLTLRRLEARLGARAWEADPVGPGRDESSRGGERSLTPAVLEWGGAGVRERGQEHPDAPPIRVPGREAAHTPRDVQVPAFAPAVDSGASHALQRVARDLAQLERVRELAAEQLKAAQTLSAERARLAALDAATQRWDQTSRALDATFARTFVESARARAAFDKKVVGEGASQAASRLRERPESFGELAATERTRAFGLVRQRDDSVARGVAREASALASEWVAAERSLAAAMGQGWGVAADASLALRAAVGGERMRRAGALEAATARERAVTAERRGLPGADVLERGLREAMRKLTPTEVQQLQASLTRPQVALAMRVRQTVKEAVLGREVGD